MTEVTTKQLRHVAESLKQYHATIPLDIEANKDGMDHMVDAMTYGFQQVFRDRIDGVWGVSGTRQKCMHSDFPGNAKQRRYMRRWHRKNNPTCNDTLMENLRLGRRCTG